MRVGIATDHCGFGLKEELGGRSVGPAVAWDLVPTFLRAEFSQAERHLRRLGKVASVALELMTASASPLTSGSGLRLVPPGGESRRRSVSASMRSRDAASVETIG